MQAEIIRERLATLRSWMSSHEIDAFVFPSTDPHQGEYVPDHWKGREWISGFDGSAGTVVITANDAALWTDSRYFIAAAQQLAGTGITLMRERIPETPTIAQWLADVMGTGKVGIDGMVNDVTSVETLRHELQETGSMDLVTDFAPLADIWTDRPDIPMNPVVLHPLEYDVGLM